MTRVAYLTFYSQIGGAEICLLTLLDGLDRSRFTPLVVVSGPGPLTDELERRGVHVVFESRMRHVLRGASSPAVLAANAWHFIRVERALLRLIRNARIDLIHAFVTPALKYGGVAAKLAGIPAAGSIHDVLAPPFSWLKRGLIATDVNLFYDRLVVPSGMSRTAALGAGVHAAKLAVVRNGVDTRRFARDPGAGARVRAAFGLAADTPLLGMVSRFVPVKRHDILLRVVREVARERPDVRCLIVGDAVFEGEQAWKLRVLALAKELEIESRVIFSGWRTDIPDLLSALDIFVQPSTEGDSFPTTVLEAMAAGLPVVTAEAGPAAEMVEDGVTGCLTATADATILAGVILGLLDDPARAKRMGEAGQARTAREFSRDRYCRDMERVYDALLPGPRPSRL